MTTEACTGPLTPRAGHRFNPKAVVLDPYALGLSGGHRWGQPDLPHGQATVSNVVATGR